MSVLITGGTGYIGSHIAVKLIEQGYDVVLLDNLSNSSPTVIQKIKEITQTPVRFYETDLLDKEELGQVFDREEIAQVIHLASLKSVNQSVEDPLTYYTNNLTGTLNLIEVMKERDIKKILFSSSATVYGETEKIPITESQETGKVTNPYGRTKFIIEQILQDLYRSDPDWNITILRYFNPVGAHPSGLIGDDPVTEAQNLIPQIVKVLTGESPYLKVYGNDFATPDGTGIRDYIHIQDLAEGHVKGLENLKEFKVYNLGTGQGYSVREVLNQFNQILGIKIPYKMYTKRPGDVPISVCDPSKAQKELRWKAEHDLKDMCKTVLRHIKLKKDVE